MIMCLGTWTCAHRKRLFSGKNASHLRPILHSERVFEVSPHQGAEKTTSKLRAFELTLETENFVPPCEEFPAFFAFSGLDETLPG